MTRGRARGWGKGRGSSTKSSGGSSIGLIVTDLVSPLRGESSVLLAGESNSIHFGLAVAKTSSTDELDDFLGEPIDLCLIGLEPSTDEMGDFLGEPVDLCVVGLEPSTDELDDFLGEPVDLGWIEVEASFREEEGVFGVPGVVVDLALGDFELDFRAGLGDDFVLVGICFLAGRGEFVGLIELNKSLACRLAKRL